MRMNEFKEAVVRCTTDKEIDELCFQRLKSLFNDYGEVGGVAVDLLELCKDITVNKVK